MEAWATSPRWSSGDKERGAETPPKNPQKKHYLTQTCVLCYPPSVPEQAVGCYCCLLEQERSPEQPDADGNGYVVCFMGGSEKGLNLYPLLGASGPSGLDPALPRASPRPRSQAAVQVP